jgi:flagellar biogenesis protein FliO
MKEMMDCWQRGLSGWLLARVPKLGKSQPRLTVVERIALTPRQSLVLVEADGRSLLVATSPDSAPAFHGLDSPPPASNSYRSIPVAGIVS